MARVAQEELGAKVTIEKQLGYVEYFSEEKERGFGFTITIVFLCSLPKGVVIGLDDQVEKFEFFKIIPENTILEQKKFLANLFLSK